MAQSGSVLRVPALSSSRFNARLARQFPAKVNKNTVKSRSTRASIVKKEAPKGALTKELAALGIEIDEDEAPADDTESHDSTERRYELLDRDERDLVKQNAKLGCKGGTHRLVKWESSSTPVTKTSSRKIVKIKNGYEGPGYLGKSPNC